MNPAPHPMKAWIIAVLAVIVAIPLFVAAQNQPSGAQSRKGGQQANPVAPLPVNCNCTTQAENSKDKPQGWHKLVTWPDGVATWALIMTLGVICWQSYETRRSVIVSLRPKLLLRGIEILPLNPNAVADIIPPRHVQIGVSNAGGTEARVTGSNLSFRRETDFSDGMHIVLPAFPPYDPNGATFSTFTLRAGEHARRTVQLNDSMSFTLMLRDAGRQDGVTVRADWFCFGFFDYQDRLGINRRTGFAFRYNIGENRFTRMDNTEYNYND